MQKHIVKAWDPADVKHNLRGRKVADNCDGADNSCPRDVSNWLLHFMQHQLTNFGRPRGLSSNFVRRIQCLVNLGHILKEYTEDEDSPRQTYEAKQLHDAAGLLIRQLMSGGQRAEQFRKGLASMSPKVFRKRAASASPQRLSMAELQ